MDMREKGQSLKRFRNNILLLIAVVEVVFGVFWQLPGRITEGCLFFVLWLLACFYDRYEGKSRKAEILFTAASAIVFLGIIWNMFLGF